MRDLFLLGLLFGFIFISFRAPYFMALGYLWIDFLQPQRMAYYVFSQLPVAMILGAGALISFLLFDKQRRLKISVIQVLIILLVAWSTMSTFSIAIVPGAENKWDWTTKALLFSAFLPFVLTTRIRIEAALATIIFSISAITVSAGLKTLLGGGGYGAISLLVNNNTGLFEGSTLATTALALVPMIWWLYKHNSFFRPSWVTFIIAFGLTLCAALITVGAEARTGLVAMAALAVIYWWRSKRKFIIGAALTIAAVVSVPFLPTTFVERMSSIQTFQADQSASTRLAVWEWTLDYTEENPLGGGFMIFKTNVLDVTLTNVSEDGDVTTVDVKERARAFHSSYFEVLGELGYPGFILWMTIVVLFYFRARGVVRKERKRLKTMDPEDPEREHAEWTASFANAVVVAIPTYMAGSLFVGIAFQPAFYHLAALTISVAFLRDERAAALLATDKKQSFRRARRQARGRASGPAGAFPAE
ncbi:MAG: putative O-glycosylation ligase, exosortase A system-associated [Pacificimonas sp.]